MHGKMEASGLTKIIPFICTSAIWGQSCFLFHLASPAPPAPQQPPWDGGSMATSCKELTHWKRLMLGGTGEKGTTEDEMAGWHH